MKIRLTFTVEVDPEEWMKTYGGERSDVRSDVHSYFRAQIQQSPAAEETGLEIVSER
ncbi:hypothetical protein ACWDR5_19590 [Streptomyces koyangensis]